MAAESLRAGYAGASDPEVLAARLTLLPVVGGKLLVETTVGEALARAAPPDPAGGGGGIRSCSAGSPLDIPSFVPRRP